MGVRGVSGNFTFERGLVWLRNDLRLGDNTALYRASRSCRALAAIFAACPETWAGHGDGDPVVAFRLANLRALQPALAERGIPLYFLELPGFTQVPAALRHIARKLRIQALFANAEYPLNEQRRDAAVRELLQTAGLAVEFCNDRTLLPPGAVTTASGGPYKVFTPFKRTVISRCSGMEFEVLPPPRKRAAEGWPEGIAAGENIKLTQRIPERLRGYHPLRERDGSVLGWQPGERAATGLLRTFLKRMDAYGEARDFPAQEGTSRLSPYLNCGAISIRQCAQAALRHNRGRWSGGSPGATCWLSELLWREFYTHLVVAFPEICRNRPFKPETERIPWTADPEVFQRWCHGETGVPIVDAAMRQLNQTGWMHNRLRMLVASFLSKNLLIDWRRGERYFMQRLVDADFTANNGGWQWAASTGTDAVPYFRVFNPYSQSRKFDPRGEFIRRYVPQLVHLNEREIHCPPPQADYPPPICDPGETRKRAIEVFAALK